MSDTFVTAYEGNTLHDGPVRCHLGNTLIDGKFCAMRVPTGYVATVYDGPSEGTKYKTRPIQAGTYEYMQFSDGFLKSDKRKLVIVSKTGFEEREMLALIWWVKSGDHQRVQVQKLPPGSDWTGAHHKDFQNDRVENVRVPPNSNATLYENDNKGGRHITLLPGYHKTKDYDLYMKVSSIDFKLDEWEELDIILGKELNKTPEGRPIVETILGTGAPGDSFSKTIALGRTHVKGTNWHVSAAVTASVTVKQGGGPAPGGVEESVSTTLESGGGGDQSKGDTRDVSVSVHGVIGESGTIEADVIGQLTNGTQQVFRRLKNVRTGEIAEVEGEFEAERFDVRFSIRHGKITDHKVKEELVNLGNDDGKLPVDAEPTA